MQHYVQSIETSKETTVIQSLGDVIAKHGLSNVVGVALLHRHFDLYKTGEIIQETISNSVSTSVVVDYKKQPLPSNVIPHFFRVNDDDSLSPLEFYQYQIQDTSREEKIHIENFLNRYLILLNSSAFIMEYKNTLLKLNALGKFGLMIRHRELVSSADPQRRTMEHSDDIRRQLQVKPVSLQTKEEAAITRDSEEQGFSIQTFWSFSPKDSGEVMWCAHSCEHGCQHGCGGHGSSGYSQFFK